jgi:hypothetical protein
MITSHTIKTTRSSRSVYITQAELSIINCHYLAADLLDLSKSVPFVEPDPVMLLAAALTTWANELTLVIEDIRRVLDDTTVA